MENNEYIEMQPRLNAQIPDTPRIIEKYTNEEGEVDVNRMASKMSQVTQQNYNFKRIFLFSSLFLVVAIGLMISANIIGAIFLRDSKVKNDRLVTTKSDVPVSVQTSLYDVPVYLFTDVEVLDGLKYLNVPVVMDGINSTLHFKINTYVSTPGKQLIFIGDKYCVILNKHNYQLVLNDKTFDPLSLNNTMDPSNEETSEVDSNTANLRTVYNSHPEVDGHKKIALTREVSAKRHMKGSDDTIPEFVNLSGKGITPVVATPRASIVNLKYHGGSLVKNGIIVPIIWHDRTNGNFNAANLQTCYKNMRTFLSDLLKSKINTQLSPGRKGSDPQATVSSVDQIHYLVPDSSRRKRTLYDSDISTQLRSWLNIAYDSNKPNSTIPKNTSNKLQYMYMIFFPSGIKLSSGFCSSYCGFHSYTNGYNYAVMPWVGDCMRSCGMSSYVSSFGGSTCGSLHSVTAHEVNEMANDPYFNGYYDRDGWESADKCGWTSPGCFKNPQTGNSYCFQQMWNHSASSSTANSAGCTKNFQY